MDYNALPSCYCCMKAKIEKLLLYQENVGYRTQKLWQLMVGINTRASVRSTFSIFIPVFAVRQVHVDVSAELGAAGGEHSKHFVLIQSSFLQTEHDKGHAHTVNYFNIKEIKMCLSRR